MFDHRSVLDYSWNKSAALVLHTKDREYPIGLGGVNRPSRPTSCGGEGCIRGSLPVGKGPDHGLSANGIYYQ